MNKIRPKKNLGQHFLRDRNIAQRIAGTLTGEGYNSVLEIGPGTGILTEFLLKRNFPDFRVIEIDNESFYFLREKYPDIREIIRGDFLSMDIDSYFPDKLAIIGNFPYNISSQILFKILDHRNRVVEVCGMLQKEVAERICSSPGSKTYGILSVLIQAFYSAEYLFTVDPDVFIPPPKVRSGVIRLRRNDVSSLDCNERLFIRVVKAGFNQRRKTLRNSIRSMFRLKNEDYRDLILRPEQLSVSQFVELTNWVEDNMILSE
ncbi:MAG TPA: 16S rRNA (adenine(1518)-N(6)/adenine(1519)-N(6))-dimethyltransferase RsmA [Bacteroidales bacterium]|jgi:16S rRNA (adenine1518-N6/adenine1519-N6)-dimethyltransferase|nr:16S rRNA (adenine(1518)-N(6)/adenine(1519)-N(6))-dimethyltransferase RsmA [Bacteroidales bacterium]OQB63320.1 MAG: Ribosomal RNA small subunit methyltransferase A [Bacteroidetes bacterium ADurb.Bin145]HOU01752.1 16S rRNA (adenine(1518)-N(6)/adenine(1519)-N(6))-dimethyltransferase RsmA [Bacteroidales bacterium]HQG62760.1 16S rRNA (adenine(1518)-N(6)/adenine(1519)-N(6))-dimethyltransferase RsmA [Bacteroidales bacterium]HQK68159.1 16S rRNA (adenine(1518)-N(6)/adenine(1519)-N(6))-dimethyltransfe